jgi:hypothetical protein
MRRCPLDFIAETAPLKFPTARARREAQQAHVILMGYLVLTSRYTQIDDAVNLIVSCLVGQFDRPTVNTTTSATTATAPNTMKAKPMRLLSCDCSG